MRYLKIKPVCVARSIADDAGTFSLDAKFAKRWPRLKERPLVSGDRRRGGEQYRCRAALSKRKAALMIGTSGAMRVAYSGEPPPNDSAGVVVLSHRPAARDNGRRA